MDNRLILMILASSLIGCYAHAGTKPNTIIVGETILNHSDRPVVVLNSEEFSSRVIPAYDPHHPVHRQGATFVPWKSDNREDRARQALHIITKAGSVWFFDSYNGTITVEGKIGILKVKLRDQEAKAADATKKILKLLRGQQYDIEVDEAGQIQLVQQ